MEGCNAGVNDGETAGQPVLHDLGNFLGIAPTGNTGEIPGMSFSRVSEGKIVEAW